MGGGPPEFRPGFTCPAVLGKSAQEDFFTHTGLSPSLGWLSSHFRFIRLYQTCAPPQRSVAAPVTPAVQRLRATNTRPVWAWPPRRGTRVPFRSPLLRKSRFLSFPADTKMFQFSALPSVRRRMPGFLVPDGLPHSDTPGSQPASDSPGINATCYVLHRLLAPRHPPCTLSSLTATIPRLARPCPQNHRRQQRRHRPRKTET